MNRTRQLICILYADYFGDNELEFVFLLSVSRGMWPFLLHSCINWLCCIYEPRALVTYAWKYCLISIVCVVCYIFVATYRILCFVREVSKLCLFVFYIRISRDIYEFYFVSYSALFLIRNRVFRNRFWSIIKR